MDITSILGIIIGLGALMTGFLIEGGSMGMLNPAVHPSPYIIIFGGTMGCVVLSFPLSDLKKMPLILKFIFTEKKIDEADIINTLCTLSEKARKDGLLSLEQESQTNPNEFLRKGLALVVDGIEPETIKDILVRETEFHENIYETGAKILEACGGFCPTMGVAGTVLGMIVILADMSDPGALGAKISVAFIATLLGVGTANLIFLPLAGKIKAKAHKLGGVDDLIIEGLLSIQAGENPRIIKEKLNLELIEKMQGKKNSNGDKEEGK